ncbi:MAG: fimbrial biogenesis outer membrane usher protein [Caulobacterales bacterium]
MRRSSHPKASARRGLSWRAGLLASCAVGGFAGVAHAQPGLTSQAQERTVGEAIPTAPQSQRLNPTGRSITLTVPAKDGTFYIGDIVLQIDPDDHLSFSSQRLLDLLSNIIDPKILETLRGSIGGKATISPADLAGSGVQVTYNPQTLELALFIPSQMRAARSLQVSALDRAKFGTFEKPAGASAYVNFRGSEDYVEKGASKGFQNPVFFIDGAARLGGVVLESQGIWQPGVAGANFQRQDTRIVWDDEKNVIRWSIGDLTPVGRGFQSSPDMAGISLYRSYSVLEPQVIARPRGDRSFSLERPSVVEVYVNGQMVRRVQLDAGNYNLRDFPFTQGANDVRLSITDDTGRVQVLRFNIFFDQSQLAKGLSEFGLYVGAEAPLQASGPHYTNKAVISGFYRRGVTDNLTLGGNFQADDQSLLAGLEAVLGTSAGTFATQIATSNIKGYGAGWAGTLTYQRLIQRQDGRSDSINVSVQAFSKNFGPQGTLVPDNPFEYEIGAGYSHAFNDYVYAGVDLHFSKGRAPNPDYQNYRATVGWRLTPTISMTTDILYEDSTTHHGIAGVLSLTARLGQYSSVRADYDSRFNDARLSYQTLHGEGVGSYNLSADVERSDQGSGFNATGNYIADRAELGLSQTSTFNGTFSSVADQRTSVRFASSIAFADGAVSVGRPIYDAFAIVTPYKTLKGAAVTIDPTPYGFQATTGALGSAIEPNMASYNERTITVDAPTAPPGVDLGKGSFRLFPPYRAGYHLEVGSEYYVTAIGRLVGEDGGPLALVSGKAFEIAHPGHEPIVVFTNRDGRFGLAGLRPGRWRIEMLSDPKTIYVVDIPANADGVVRTGDIKPTNGQ